MMVDNKIETELLSQIKEVLLKFPKYWEKDVLLRNKVAEDLKLYDHELIKALLSNKLIKDTYSMTLDTTIIFKIEDFISMLRYKNYWDNSYTKYTNKIGLTSEGKYLNYNTDVVLDFPHKDSVLEAGMKKEDSGKKEIYYHNILAKEEIDTLLSPKILSNITKYSKSGNFTPTEFKEDDNLIIKGNNLVAINLLKERYQGKVNVIYIDPPYNTGNDSFKYNDKFNHSTWLTFMRNRLEIARDLLTEDGSIFIQIDDSEDSYLKVIMDEIFGENNFRNKITWRRRGGSANPSNRLNNVAEYILWYSKNEKTLKYEPVYSLNDDNTQKYIKERFTNIDKNGRKFMKSPIQSPNYRPNLVYDYKGYRTPPKGYSVSKDVLKKWDEEDKIFLPEDKSQNINRKIYLDEYKGQPISSLWTDIYVINPMSKEREESFTSGQKPEALIQRILSMVTEENDIVLDFFMGSATTQAVAMKMNRQFIGIEQMDYINTISVPRLQKVIEGEQSGISKDVEWEGGGSFVYAELSSLNNEYIKNIQASNSEEELEKVLFTMKESAYFNFKVDLERVSSKDEGYHALSLEEKKEVLIQVLDMNQLYLSYSEIEDEQYKISEDVKSFNHSFYQKEGVQDE